MGLTAKGVEKLRTPGRHGDGHGLYLKITDSGVKSWIFRYQRIGRERFMGLGPLHTVSLKQARERARRAREQLLDGIDPLDARQEARQAQALAAAKRLTFEEAAEKYYKQHEAKWKNPKHSFEFMSSLRRYAFPKIGNLGVGEIDTGLVLKCIEPIWKTKTETANRTRGRIEKVLDWCSVRGYREGDNPARWKGHLDNVLPARRQVQKTKHFAALPWAELSSFMEVLNRREGTAARALEFTILTASRTSEVIEATWDEIDLDGRVWTIPAERMKAEKEHRVPLTDECIRLLKALPSEAHNPYVFIGPQNGSKLSNMAMIALLKRMKRTDITVHGFRSTFRDWAAETTNYQNHIVEMALAHTIGNSVERAYRRGDLLEKRARLMHEWAKFAKTPTAISKAGEVVALRRA